MIRCKTHLLAHAFFKVLAIRQIDGILLACVEMLVNTYMRKEGGLIINHSKLHSVLAEGGELCVYCALIVRLLCVNSASIVRE